MVPANSLMPSRKLCIPFLFNIEASLCIPFLFNIEASHSDCHALAIHPQMGGQLLNCPPQASGLFCKDFSPLKFIVQLCRLLLQHPQSACSLHGCGLQCTGAWHQC